MLMVSLIGAGAASCGDRGAYQKGREQYKSTRVADAKGAKVKQWLHDFLSHLWVDFKEAADGADGRAECGKRRSSW